MDYKNFQCAGESLEQIPIEIEQRTGVTFPRIHQETQSMAILAKELKVHRGDSFARIPFCVTVEAEAMGGHINLGNNILGPRVLQYLCKNIDEADGLKSIDLSQGRIKAVLDCVQLLSREGETVALNVEGPLTIISSLMDPAEFFKGVRKHRDKVDRLLHTVEENITKYILAGIEKGARIVSYADPVGAMDIVGPKVYREISGQSSYNILKKIEAKLENTLVHLCGKTSTALDKTEFCTTEPINVEGDITYGQALCNLLEERKDIRFVGHRCIKKAPSKLTNSIVWGIKLK